MRIDYRPLTTPALVVEAIKTLFNTSMTIGVFIPDDQYRPELEGATIAGILGDRGLDAATAPLVTDEELLKWLSTNRTLLSMAQEGHDTGTWKPDYQEKTQLFARLDNYVRIANTNFPPNEGRPITTM